MVGGDEIMIYEDALNIYTDGSSFQKPRRGGVGIRFIWIDDSSNEVAKDVNHSGYKGATNIQMEIQACVLALKEAQKLDVLNRVSRIVIFTDLQLLADNYHRAMFTWPKNHWRGLSGKPIDNAEQWRDLSRAIKRIRKRVEIEWVKGHAKDIHNKAVDKIARNSAQHAFNKPLTVVNIRRKLTSKSVEISSVKLMGQRVSVRIITSEYLRLSRTNKYKYEVISKSSPFRGNVDIAYSSESLKRGHNYSVRFNKDTRNPTIEKVFREIIRRDDNV